MGGASGIRDGLREENLLEFWLKGKGKGILKGETGEQELSTHAICTAHSLGKRSARTEVEKVGKPGVLPWKRYQLIGIEEKD